MSTEIAKSESNQSNELSVESFQNHKGRMLTTLDVTDPNDRKRLVAAMSQQDANLVDEVGVPIQVVAYSMYDDSYVDKDTGEVRNGVKLLLHDAQGFNHSTWGFTLIKSFTRIVAANGKGPWNPPLTLTLRAKGSNGKFKYWFESE